MCAVCVSRHFDRAALRVAYDPKARSPFAAYAHKYGLSFPGGKLDDTMAIVSLVISNPGDEEDIDDNSDVSDDSDAEDSDSPDARA